MTTDRPPCFSPDDIAELFREICEKLESHDDKLDEILDHLPSSNSYDSNLDDD